MRLDSYTVVVAAGLLGACGSSATSSPAPGSDTQQVPDAGSAAPTPVADAAPAVPPADNGAPSTTYPAFKPDMPQLQDNGGDTLKTPVFVTVTWPGEPNADYYESFGDGLGATDYWTAVTGEYGIGPGASGATNHVRMKAALAASVSDADLDALVDLNASAGAGADASKWPAPTTNTVYILYLPTTSTLKLTGVGDACSVGVGGYHAATQTGHVSYAIVPQCTNSGAQLKNYTTFSASHELAEAALDARPESSGFGWFGLDDAHASWTVFQQNQVENGDLCEAYRDSIFQTTGDKSGNFKFYVQRQWSNKSVLAGHNPCVPATATYFNTTLLKPEPITVDLSGQPYMASAKTKATGVQIAVGETRTFQIGFFSDAAAPAWTIAASEGSPFQQTKPTNLEITLDKTSGQNGEKANVTVKVNKLGAERSELVVITSSVGQVQHSLPILIGSP